MRSKPIVAIDPCIMTNDGTGKKTGQQALTVGKPYFIKHISIGAGAADFTIQIRNDDNQKHHFKDYHLSKFFKWG